MSLARELTLAKDLTELWPSLKISERRKHFYSLSRTTAEELFLSLSPEEQVELIVHLSDSEIRSWIRFLPPPAAANIIQILSGKKRLAILSQLDDETRHEVIGLLAYTEDAADGLMSSEYIRLRPEISLSEAIGYIRSQSKKGLKISYAYVLDHQQTLLGVVSIHDILLEPSNKAVETVMNKDLIFAPANMIAEDVARIFANSKLMALPVLDENRKMKGIVTQKDLAGAVQKAATKDIQKIGGMEALSAPYFDVSFFQLFRKRAAWLILFFLGEMFTATAMGFYEDEISKAVIFALFVPLIISSGGNSGSQASTLIIRSLALYEIRLSDWWRVFLREFAFGITLGSILAAFGLLRIVLWQQWYPIYGDHYILVAMTVSFSLFGVILWGTLAGSMMPFILGYLKFDPASASAPLIATLVDITGLIIYFFVANICLGWGVAMNF